MSKYFGMWHMILSDGRNCVGANGTEPCDQPPYTLQQIEDLCVDQGLSVHVCRIEVGNKAFECIEPDGVPFVGMRWAGYLKIGQPHQLWRICRWHKDGQMHCVRIDRTGNIFEEQ